MADGAGYLRLTGFDDVAIARPLLSSAFALLADVRGIIVDVRGNRGGDSETMQLVLRSFLPAGAPVSLQRFDRKGVLAPEIVPEPAWARYSATLKVSVIIDRASASAAEALAYAIQDERRGTVIGVRSLGAAHEVRTSYPLPGGFQLFIPEWRFQGRNGGRDWEVSGVQPDLAAEGPDAILVAWRQVRTEAH